MITFEIYLHQKTNNSIKNLTQYCGIKKIEHPKWAGWKELERMKSQNIRESEYLDVLVYNFYIIRYIGSKLYLKAIH